MVSSANISNASEYSPTALTLQSLIDARHDVHRYQSSVRIGLSDFPGQRTGTRRGQGMEFIDLRQYNPSDDVRHIDWNVTARSNEPYTRLYREEREHVTTVVVDLRPLMFTGSHCLRAVSAAQNAARVLWQANASGDRCAAMVISTNGIEQNRPMTGNKGVLRSLELISTGFATTQGMMDWTQRNNRSENTVLSDVLALINQSTSTSGSYFLLSGFDTADDKSWPTALAAASMSGQLKAILLLDRLELTGLPDGIYRYRTRNKKASVSVNNNNQVELIKSLRQRIEKRQMQFTAAGVPLVSVDTSHDGSAFLTQLLKQQLL